jgi:uncharacterized protein (TIGR04255 family)
MSSISSAQLIFDPQGMPTPKKLRDDAIIEALCMLRFSAPELAEVVIGRLSDVVNQQEYTAVRLPLADIPAPVRNADPQLRMQPILELRHKDKKRLVRLSESVISFHVVGEKNYCGWSMFREELQAIFGNVFNKLSRVDVKGIGFRYVNAIVQPRHYISDAHDLKLELKVAGERLTCPVNINYVDSKDGSHVITTRIAHPTFVQGKLPSNTSVIIDVEVNTPNDFKLTTLEAVNTWIDAAHEFEKEAFFKLIPDEVLKQLVEN